VCCCDDVFAARVTGRVSLKACEARTSWTLPPVELTVPALVPPASCTRGARVAMDASATATATTRLDQNSCVVHLALLSFQSFFVLFFFKYFVCLFSVTVCFLSIFSTASSLLESWTY